MQTVHLRKHSPPTLGKEGKKWRRGGGRSPQASWETPLDFSGRLISMEMVHYFLTGHHSHWFPIQLLWKPAFHEYFFLNFLISLPPAALRAWSLLRWTEQLQIMLSFILQVNRPHPGDHPLLIIFMVGGVTVSEVKMVKDLVATRKPGTQVETAQSVPIWTKIKEIHEIMVAIALVPYLDQATAADTGMALGFCGETSVSNKCSRSRDLFFCMLKSPLNV